MAFCPNCRFEYKQGIAVCPDCGEKLVESLDEENTHSSGSSHEQEKDWVTIGRLTSQHYADLLVEALKSKDIPAVVLSKAGHFGQTGQMGIASYRPVGGAYEVKVPAKYADKADKEAAEILGDVWTAARQ